MSQHPSATVAPMALLVPVFGLGSSALLLGEPLQWWKILAFALVMAGLSLGVLWPRFMAKPRA
ncbi:MAG: EamA family transporter [Novosphingobium sp.]